MCSSDFRLEMPAILLGVDAKTGATLWISEGRQAANAAVLSAGDLLFSLEDDGELIVVRSSRTEFNQLRRDQGRGR